MAMVTMSEDHDPIFTSLTDGNYTEWEIWMEADLVEKGLCYDFIFNTYDSIFTFYHHFLNNMP